MINPKELKVPAFFIDKYISPACGADIHIIEAFKAVPREFFVDEAMRSRAYSDNALPIGFGQTISQPSLVAMMIKALEVEKCHKVLEIGAGSGFVSALLGKLADEIYGVELIPELYQKAQERVRRLMLNNVKINLSDGTIGLPDKSPFDRIVVSAGAKNIPVSLEDQLVDGGIMVIPVSGTLIKAVKTADGLDYKKLAKVAFVDFVGT